MLRGGEGGRERERERERDALRKRSITSRGGRRRRRTAWPKTDGRNGS